MRSRFIGYLPKSGHAQAFRSSEPATAIDAFRSKSPSASLRGPDPWKNKSHFPQPGIRVVGDASSGEEALRKAAKVRPEIVIIDLMMPGMDGVETTRRFTAEFPGVKALILTTFGTAEGISQALEAGARGAVLKSASLKNLTDSIRKVARGEIAISDEIANILSADPPIEPLSPRQQEVLESLVRGLSNDEIAKQLEISKPVVKEHINVLYRKLGAANRSEAIGIALRKHLLKN